MASGSLRQFVSVTSSARLTGTAIDDPENTLYQYLPNGKLVIWKGVCRKRLIRATDCMNDEIEFMKQVEEDAINFKPMGEKIHSYVRRRRTHKGKDPRDRAIERSKEEVREDDDGAITYEAYHVSP